MWHTSKAFDVALRAPQRTWQSRVDILYAGELIQALDVLIDGNVSFDRVAVRRSGTFRLTDPSGALTPRDARDLLTPKGTELRPFRGLVLANGSVEWVPLGVLRVKQPRISRDSGGTLIEVTAHDRSAAVKQRRFTDPYVIATGTPTHQAIADIVTSRLNVDTRITVTGHTTPGLTYDILDDPWEAVEDLALADSLTAYFDPLGSLAVTPDVPTETGVVYQPGPESFLLSTDRFIDGDKAYSGVIVRVEHPEQDPIRAEAWDLDPKSPTYSLGEFGRVPYGYSSPVITDLAQAQSAARTLLPKVTKMRQEATLTTIGHPGHEVGDLVTVLDPNTKTEGKWVVVGGDVPLRPRDNTLKLEEYIRA